VQNEPLALGKHEQSHNAGGSRQSLATPHPEEQGVPQERAPEGRWILDPALPLISLVLAATAVPIDLRFESLALTWRIEAFDVIANLIGYIPIGIVLARLGPGRAIALATLIAMLAESTQVFAMFRFVSPLDVVWNSAGAAIGVLVSNSFGARVH
jgi:glycopeptide antibiotics resistance protein